MGEVLSTGERARQTGSGGAEAALRSRGVERVGPATERGLGGSAVPARGAAECPGAGKLSDVPGPWQAVSAGRAQRWGRAGRSPDAAGLVRMQ